MRVLTREKIERAGSCLYRFNLHFVSVKKLPISRCIAAATLKIITVCADRNQANAQLPEYVEYHLLTIYILLQPTEIKRIQSLQLNN